MRNIKNRTASTVSAIHGITFTVFFIIDSVLNKFFYPYLESHVHEALAMAISAIIAAGLYSVVYFICSAIYTFMIKRRDKKYNIDGTWYHVHIPKNITGGGREDYLQTQLSCGVTKVSRNFYDFTFVANNQKYYMKDNEIKIRTDNETHWYTKCTRVSDENDFDLIEIYEAKTNGIPRRLLKSCPCCKTEFQQSIEIQEAEKFRHGIHKINIYYNEDINHMYMKAEYSDCWPSFKYGDLYFYRTEKERDDRIRQYFEEAKIWEEENKQKQQNQVQN